MTGRATEATPEALFVLFRDWQRIQTQSSATAPRSPRQQMDVRFCRVQEPTAERQTCAVAAPDRTNNALSRARTEGSCFSVDKDLHGCRLYRSFPTRGNVLHCDSVPQLAMIGGIRGPIVPPKLYEHGIHSDPYRDSEARRNDHPVILRGHGDKFSYGSRQRKKAAHAQCKPHPSTSLEFWFGR
jgi:hypothetical protein